MDYTYQNGFFGAKSTSILSKTDILELASATKADFLSILKLKNYGSVTELTNIDEVIKSEKAKNRADLYEVLDDHELFAYLYLKHDITNVLMMFKTLVFDKEKGVFDPMGNLSETSIYHAIKNSDFDQTSPFWKHILETLMSETLTLDTLSLRLTQLVNLEVREMLLRRKDVALWQHFIVSADIQNVLMIVKSFKLGLYKNEIGSLLNPHGTISFFEGSYDGHFELESISKMINGHYYGRISTLLDHFIQDNDFFRLEISLYNLLLDELKPYENEVNNASNIISYLIKKELEAIYIKRAFLEKTNDVSWYLE